MTSVAYVEEQLQHVLGSRANELARETGCIVRQRKFDGATLVQILLFGFQQHVHASLEQLASTGASAGGVGDRQRRRQALYARRVHGSCMRC